MLTMSDHLISSDAPSKAISPRRVGGKGWNLFRLHNHGFPVPRWWVVPSDVFDNALVPFRAAINGILSRIDFSDPGSIDKSSHRIQDLIHRIEIRSEFCQDLAREVEEKLGKQALLSVRSSVIGEDSSDHSFAGQMDSFLNVRIVEIPRAIKMVWASAFSARALTYRKKKHIDASNLSVAVIIQKMVQSEASGVLFTRHPESRAKECMICAGFGLGEGVVQDMVETDTYRIGWDGDEITRDVHEKHSRLALGANGTDGVQVESLPDHQRSQQVLTLAQICRLRDLGVKAERCFGCPQDMEWAFDAFGYLHFLQTRPIVFPHSKPSPSSARIWDNSNIVESYPGLTLPLTFCFIRTGYENTFRNAALGFVLRKNEIKKKNEIFRNMIGLLEGRVYYNLLNWYEMLSFLPDFKRHHKEAWDRMIGIAQKIDFPQNKRSFLDNLYTMSAVVWKLLTVKSTAKRFFAHFRSAYNQFKDIDFSQFDEHQLLATYNALSREFLKKWHLTAYNDFCATKYYDWLSTLCGKWGLGSYPNLHNHLLCREQGVESVAPVRSLVSLAETIRANPTYRELISGGDSRGIWQRIQSEPQYAAVKDALETHLSAFGDRGLEELKLETKTFREEPEKLIDLIKNYCRHGLTMHDIDKQEKKIRNDAEEFLRQTLKNPIKKLLFRFVLRKARMAVAYRENMRFARSRLYGIVRHLFQRMADLFVARGLLESSSDIYYLTMDEVFGTVQGTAVTRNLQALVELRKSEYAEFARLTPKDRIETTGIPALNLIHGCDTDSVTGNRLMGVGCSSGIVQGKAKVVLDPHCTAGDGDSILIARSTDPGWVFLMISSKGIVVEKGSVLSHTAIIGRELGIPTVVGVKDATKLIPDGAQITINGSTGEVRWQ